MITNIILQEKKEIANNTVAFYFNKPDGFLYKAGQSVDITLLNPPETDSLGNTRTFTLSSAPFEDHLMVAVRMRTSAFKRMLNTMRLGTEVGLEGPYGTFTLHDNHELPAVFLTGGIGVTPVFTIMKQATYENRPQRMLLFYSNRTPEDAPFIGDFEKMAENNLNFTFIPTMTQDESWAGIKGRITKDLLSQHIRDFTKSMYYLSGPIAMTTDLRDMLLTTGVNEDNIIFEDFPGY